jgi:glucose-6-phosphate-specific signal transduction histidine kinase
MITTPTGPTFVKNNGQSGAKSGDHTHPTDENLALSISDDGIGGADSGKGSGLLGLRDRVEVLGGRMRYAMP